RVLFRSDAAGSPVNQKGFTVGELTTVEYVAPDSEIGLGQAGCFDIAEACRNRQALFDRSHAVFCIAASGHQRTYLNANLETSRCGVAAHDFTAHFKIRKDRSSE